MKRFPKIFALLMLPVLFLVPSCGEDDDNGSEVALNVVLSSDKVDLQIGESVTISASVLPASLNMGVTWSVIDEEYASVVDGTITGKAEGVTYVIATSADGYQKAACMVSVNPPIEYSISLRGANGELVKALYGYPGMTTVLNAVASDGETHSYTWSVENESVATVTGDGHITLGACASTDAAYVYDGQTFLTVVSEDGSGCKIPIRSSLLNGLLVDDFYNPAGTPIIVQKSGAYPVSALYQEAEDTAEIPADGINLEIDNTAAFALQKEGNLYMLVTGPSDGVSTHLFASPVGSSEKKEIAFIRIDKVYAIKAQFADASSSTLSFTWTCGGSTDDDIAKPYTISLYRDEDCTDLEVSFSIPAGDGCWKGRQPKFVFSGLEPATPYWFQVIDSSDAEVESPVIPAETLAFTNIMVSSDPASVGDIILAEDFGQMCWGADEVSQAAGYDVATSDVAYNTDTKKSFTSRDAAVFVGTTGQYAQRSLTAQSVAKKESGVRIAKWAQGQYARIYIGPGYLFLSTKSYGTHIITPELKNIPQGTTAKLKVTLHAAGSVASSDAVLAVQHGISFNEISSGTQTNKNKLDLSTNVKSMTFSGGLTSLEEFEIVLDGVVSGDRIAFGPPTETAVSNANMMLISDMTVQILELN